MSCYQIPLQEYGQRLRKLTVLVLPALDASSPQASLPCEEGMMGVEDKIPQSQCDLRSEGQHKQRGRARTESELTRELWQVRWERVTEHLHWKTPRLQVHRYLVMMVQLWAPVGSRSTPIRVHGKTNLPIPASEMLTPQADSVP